MLTFNTEHYLLPLNGTIYIQRLYGLQSIVLDSILFLVSGCEMNILLAWRAFPQRLHRPDLQLTMNQFASGGVCQSPSIRIPGSMEAGDASIYHTLSVWVMDLNKMSYVT